MVSHVMSVRAWPFNFAVLRTKFLWKLGKDVSGVVIGLSWMRIVAVEVDLGHDRCFFHLGDCCFVLAKRRS